MNKSITELCAELCESTDKWASAINELEQVLLARGFVTREAIANAQKMEGKQS
jgi:mannitol/fructose-specific phosphotransferase system IIA component (Ntr-type)